MKVGSRPLLATGALALCGVMVLTAGCGREARDWRKQLRHPDSFERMLAALALCEKHPRQSAPAILVLFETMRSEVPRNRAAAEHALESMAEYKLEELAEFLIVAGPTRDIVRTKVTPLLIEGPAGTGAMVLEVWRRNDWTGPDEVRRVLLNHARRRSEFALHLAAQYATAEPGDRALLWGLMLEACPAFRVHLQEGQGDLEPAERAALESLAASLREAEQP